MFLDFSDGGFLGYINECERNDKIEKAIEMFSSPTFDVEDDWDRQYVLNACDLNDITNEEAQAILKGLGR